MLGKTHKAIARFTARKLNLKKRETNLLEIGSIRPDSWANFPHHKGKEYEIAVSIFDSRRRFLQNDDECFHDLGIALHYIADRWTLRPRISEKHTEWERQIDSAIKNNEIYNYPQLKEYVKTCTFPSKYTQRYLSFIEKCESGVEGMGDKLGFAFPLIDKVVVMDKRLKKIFKFQGEQTFVESVRKVYGEKISYWWCYWVERSGIINLEKEKGYKGYLVEWWLDNLKKIGVKPLCGLGAKTVNFALLERRTSVWSTPALDLNFATWISLEVARNTLLESGQGEWFDLERFPKSKDKE